MGFEPFIPPKRPDPAPDKLPSDAPREERVLALARMLHQRGITSSMADAKRLAEGMVDVDKKVIRQQKAEPAPVHLKAEIPGTTAVQLPKPSFGLSLPEDFAQFVARAALSDKPHPAAVPKHEAPVEEPVVYGRDEQHVIASVPHFYASNQRMFDDAPDMTKLRGYSAQNAKPGTPVKDIDFQSQREKAIEQIAKPSPVDAVVRVESGDDAVKIVRSESAPDLEIVEEKAIYAEPDTIIPPAAPAPTAPAAPAPSHVPSAAELLAEELKDAPEETVELPKSERKQYTDPAKEHGVDLFNMFKKK